MTDAVQPEPVQPEPAQSDTGVTKPPRPAILTLTQAVLALEAFAAIFAMLAVFGLDRAGYLDSPWWVTFVVLPLVAVLMMLAAARQKERWGRPLGWALQAPLILVGVVDGAVAIIGVCFLLTWILAVWLGTKIDRERAEYNAAQAEGGAGA